MQRAIDAYLTRKARQTWKGALVYKEPDGSFTLERQGQERVGLGADFRSARQALGLLRRSDSEV